MGPECYNVLGSLGVDISRLCQNDVVRIIAAGHQHEDAQQSYKRCGLSAKPVSVTEVASHSRHFYPPTYVVRRRFYVIIYKKNCKQFIQCCVSADVKRQKSKSIRPN